MRKLFPVLLLATLTAVGYSQQPPPHIGEWDAKLYSETKEFKGNGYFYFSEDGTLQIIEYEPHRFPITWFGKYVINYSKHPISIDIEWEKEQSVSLPIHGIVRFIGEKKDRMHIVYDTKTRPSSFHSDSPFLWLTKKVKK